MTDEMLYQCMPVLGNKLLETLPSDDALTYEPSEQFHKKMEQLIKRAELKEKWGVPVQTWKRVAAAIIVVLIGTITVSMSVEAFRKKVFEFIETIHETFVSTTYLEDAEMEFKPFKVGYIPRGYKLAIHDEMDNYFYQSYEKQVGDKIESLSIMQQQIYEGLIIDINSECIKTETCIIQGCTAEIGYTDTGTIHIKWEKDDCVWIVHSRESKEEMLKVCESLH